MDLIDRQAAIDFIDAGHLCNPNEPRWSDNEIVNFLKSRPSAQPEIEERKEESAQNVSKEDLISRKAAIEAHYDYCNKHPDAGFPVWSLKILKDLLSAQPERKTGRWIDAVLPNDNGGLPVEVCDQCNTFFPLAFTGGGLRYCPNCGADMGGDTDEAD